MDDTHLITLLSGFCFDFTHMFAPGGLKDEELDALFPQLQAAEEGLSYIRREGRAYHHLSKDGVPEAVYFTRLPYIAEDYPNTPQLMAQLEAFGKKVSQGFDVVLFSGVGGSYLGGKVLYDCYQSEFWTHHDTPAPKVFFVGNNMDTEDMKNIGATLLAMANAVKEQEGRKLRVMLVPISKSGTTMEPTTGFLFFYDRCQKHADKMELSVTVVTDPAQKDGPLMRLSKAYDWEVFPVPYGIGGRFSVLSTPGLIVAATLGMNLFQLLAGAANMDEVCRGSDWRRNPALFGAAVKYLAARDHGASIEVFMPYAMRLKALGEWYVQLLAESLGKREDRNGQTVFYGRTPLVAIGTTDMHAQTQLHQDGIRDKVVQFLFIDSLKGKIHLHNPFPEIQSLRPYENMDIGRALEIAMEANEEALMSDGRMSALYRLPQLDEFYLGQMFYYLMLSIAYEGELANVDAFDQPGVEVYKKIMRRKLGK